MNPEPIISDSTTKPAVPVKKDKVSKVLRISIVVVLIVLVCLGTFWGGMYYSEKNSSANKTAQNNTVVTPTVTPTPTASPVPTKQELKDLVQAIPSPTPTAKPTTTPVNPYKDWKTYTSGDMKISLKYKTFSDISYDKDSGQLSIKANGKSVLLTLYHYTRINELNAGKNMDAEDYINPRLGFDYMAETYANPVTVKVGTTSYTTRHLLYGDGPMNSDPTKCDASNNGFEHLYTEIYKGNSFQGDPIGVDVYYNLLISNDLCNGQDAPEVKEQKALVDELLKTIESIAFM